MRWAARPRLADMDEDGEGDDRGSMESEEGRVVFGAEAEAIAEVAAVSGSNEGLEDKTTPSLGFLVGEAIIRHLSYSLAPVARRDPSVFVQRVRGFWYER